MRSVKLYFIIALSFTFLQISLSQKFSEKPSEFIVQITDFMGNNLTENDKNILSEFTELWKNDSTDFFKPEIKSTIIETSNILVANKARSVPHFRDYMKCLLSFKKNINQRNNNFDNWHKGIKVIFENEKPSISDINTYLNFTYHLIDSNYVYYSYSTKWKSKNSDYKFTSGKEIKVKFGTTDLSCYALRDSIAIFNTSGDYNPIEEKWEGTKGLVTWERAGFNRDSVYAELVDYEINMSKFEYQADDVVFTNKLFFKKPLKGVLIDKVKHNQSFDDAIYPKFDSYQKDFSIENIYENINYEGGLSMQGAKMVGTGSRTENAKITLYRKDTLLMSVASDYFAFKSDRVNGINSSIVIKLKKDSIFHPGIDFRYIVPRQEVTLSRSDRFTSQSPYFNSYQNIDMSFEQLVWKTNEPQLHFKASVGAAEGIAGFESVDFFNMGYFMKLQGMDEVHPLISIRSFARSLGGNTFNASDFAEYLRMPVHLVKQLLMRMSVAGFIYYDTDTEIATIKPKLTTYIAASVAKIDYDVISIPSRTSMPLENAVLDLTTYDLTINGVPQIFLSDSQNVVILPKREKIIMKKDRSFQFDGTVIAGLLKFEGENFFFKYDSFKVNLQNVDKLSLKFLTGKFNNYGEPLVDDVTTEIQHVTGELLVDRPDNKSGRFNYPEYPVFISKENSFVFYEKPDIFNSVYDQSDFYFELDPYVMDSLDNFTKESLKYNGEFVSAGILPPMKQTISLQPDKSLGFLFSTATEGLPLYGGKGVFKDEISLSNQGLRGKGSIEYLTSVTISDNILFFPDSVNIQANEFNIAKATTGTAFPLVNSRNNYIHWLPYGDEMQAYMKDADFTMFNDSTHLNGNLTLRPDGLSGSGRMDLKNSDLISDSFVYKSDEIFADTSNFYLKSLHSSKFTVLTENVRSHIDYRTKTGNFTSNDDYTLVNFPENRYVSYLDNFTWDMDKKELAMGSSKSISTDTSESEVPVGPTYISTHPQQDSLNFVSPLAYYNYKDNILKATGVKFIEVADARVYPSDGDVIVEQDAKMRLLEKATVTANQVSKYHKFHHASINIYGRKKYEGTGNYDYIDENETIQNIHFNKISVDENLQTIASGNIFEPDSFRLSPNYQYQGKVFLAANNKLLDFDGAVKLEHACDIIESKWLDFVSEIDPLKIYIPVPEQPVDINNARIYTGMFIHYDSTHIYPSFFTPRLNYSDRNIVPASGYLYYDKPSQLYKIASKEKLENRDTLGNYLSLHRETCEMFSEGKVDLGINLGMVKTVSAGNVRHNILENNTSFDIVLGFDFLFSENIMSVMASDIDSVEGLEATDLNRITYNRAVNELAGPEQVRAFKDELNLYGTVKNIPSGLKHTIVFNDLKLVWSDETNSYISVGKIGIASINNIQINKLVDGLIEIQLKRSGDICDIYLEADRRTWYYFGYTRGVMQVLSSNKNFVDAVIGLKAKERKQKSDAKTLDSYIYMIATDRKKAMFYRRYQEIMEERQNEKKE